MLSDTLWFSITEEFKTLHSLFYIKISYRFFYTSKANCPPKWKAETPLRNAKEASCLVKLFK